MIQDQTAMGKRILVSWVGNTDLHAYASTLKGKAQQEVVEFLGSLRDNVGVGPVKDLLDHESFDDVHLLSNLNPRVFNKFTKWLSRKVCKHDVELSDPTDYRSILAIVRPILESLNLQLDDELCFHLSPGTPAMASIWILLGKSQYPATLFQTYYGKITQVEIPFDITTDVIPLVLREPDRMWIHLAVQSPGEIQGFDAVVGTSEAIRLATGRAQRAAIHDVPILILGESGTGKEVFARAVHKASHRRERPFIAVNCAAFSKDLLESELFGHTKGAFTGANKPRDGAFQQAHGGTLFLDEVGECDLAMQAKLLRALQPPPGAGPCCRIIRAVGAEEDVELDVRVIAATNSDLKADISSGRFREDLMFRLSTITLKLPPLRSRGRDVLLLAEHFLDQANRQLASNGTSLYSRKKLSVSAKQFVRRHTWPGNVRELSNVLTQAAIMVDGDIIKARDLQAAISEMPFDQYGIPDLNADFCIDDELDVIRCRYIVKAMQAANGKVTQAAKLLGMNNHQTLSQQIKKHGLGRENWT